MTEISSKATAKDALDAAEKLRLKNIIPGVKTFETAKLEFLDKLGEGKFCILLTLLCEGGFGVVRAVKIQAQHMPKKPKNNSREALSTESNSNEEDEMTSAT